MSIYKNVIQGLRNIITIKNLIYSSNCEQKRQLLQQAILNKTTPGVTSKKHIEQDVIISLTSYGNRIYEVALTIESLMEQTILPNRIILWLSYNEKNIPQALRLLEKRGLEINFCEDIGSYKKLIPTLRNYHDDIIITVDDDVFYDFDLIENLIITHKEFPNDILAHRMHRITLNKDMEVAPYKEWHQCIKDYNPSFLNFAVGVGGVLYPPNSLDSRVFDESTFMDICKYGDDIWFKCMSILNNVQTRGVYSHNKKGEDYLPNMSISEFGLFSDNVIGNNRNDSQIKAVFEKYEIYNILKSQII